MAQTEMQSCEDKRTKRKLHTSLRIDMTPMVDLGFLLISFFIFTTTLSEKKMLKLYMPADKGNASVLGESKVLTVLLGSHNTVLAYEGRFEDAEKQNKIIPTNYGEYDGFGKLIREKQKQLQWLDIKNGKNNLVFLIKPSGQSSYKNVIDALDEATINGVKKYMIVDISAAEKTMLNKMN